MTIDARRWMIAIVLLCATAAVALLPLAPGPTWTDWEDASLRVQADRWRVVAGRLGAAAHEYRTAHMMDRWRSSAGATTPVAVAVDTTVPRQLSIIVDSLLRLDWQRLGPTASADRAAAFVVFDTMPLLPPGHSREWRQPLEVSYVLPLPGTATSGRCIALVRIGTTDPAALVVPQGSLFGPCGFYAVFGPPGAKVYDWLARTEFAFARMSDWATPRAPVTTTWLDLSGDAATCSLLANDACLDGLGLGTRIRPGRASPAAPGRTLSTSPLPVGFIAEGGLTGRADARLLADLRRQVGEERFRNFWSSPGTVPEAFAAAAGVPAQDWLGEWLGGARRPRSTRPILGVPVSTIVWIAVALPLLLAVTTRRRDRVLPGRAA